jgi:hypothetical protein
MIFPFAGIEVPGISDPQSGRDAVMAESAGGEKCEIVAGAVEVVRYVAMLGQRSIVPLDQCRDDPLHGSQIAIRFSPFRHADAHLAGDRMVDDEVLQRVRIVAGLLGNSESRVYQRPGSD